MKTPSASRPLAPPPRPILLVEDNPMDIDFALQAFAESKVANPVILCRDGEEALDFIHAHGTPHDRQLPLVALLDLRLPKVDGLEVLRQAREDAIWKQIPFVILTTSREDTDISRGYAAGANSYIVKPVNFTAFAEVVQHINAYWLLINQPPYAQPAPRSTA